MFSSSLKIQPLPATSHDVTTPLLIECWIIHSSLHLQKNKKKTKKGIPKQVSATSLSLHVAKVTCALVKCCPNPIYTYLSPCGLTHSLT